VPEGHSSVNLDFLKKVTAKEHFTATVPLPSIVAAGINLPKDRESYTTSYFSDIAPSVAILLRHLRSPF
jgi:hypothetical protein